MDGYCLPVKTLLGDEEFSIHADFRDILEIFSYLEDPSLPEMIRWRIAVALFYDREVPNEKLQQAMEYLAFFIAGGEKETGGSVRKLLDWEQDSGMIIAEVNRVCHQEVRALPFLHWWTFLGWFHTIGQGQLSTVVALRDKLQRGKKLEGWEKDFYRENKGKVDLKKRYTPEELEQKLALEALLAGKGCEVKNGKCWKQSTNRPGT